MLPSWIRVPQDPADEHDWVVWFDDPVEYRGKRWNYGLESWVYEEVR